MAASLSHHWREIGALSAAPLERLRTMTGNRMLNRRLKPASQRRLTRIVADEADDGNFWHQLREIKITCHVSVAHGALAHTNLKS